MQHGVQQEVDRFGHESLRERLELEEERVEEEPAREVPQRAHAPEPEVRADEHARRRHDGVVEVARGPDEADDPQEGELGDAGPRLGLGVERAAREAAL